MVSTGNIFSDVGSAVGDLFKSEGNAAEANSYTSAAQLEQQNAQLSATATRIQQTQTARTVAQSLGTTQADVAGAGFTESGSALDLLRSSAQQGSLAKSLVNIQGAINENSYAAEAGADLGKAKAANEAQTAGTIGAIASIGGSLISGTNQLVSAGKTVAQGYNYLFGSSTAAAAPAAFGDASTLGTTQLTGAIDPTTGLSVDMTDLGGASDISTGGGLSIDMSGIGGAQSATDMAIQDGVTLDTSAPGLLGQSADAVSGAVSSAFSDVTSALSSGVDGLFGAGASEALGAAFSSIIPGLGLVSLIDMIPGVNDIPVVGPVLGAVSGVINDVSSAVVSAVSDVGSAIGSFFGSVICTALYKRGMVSREAWLGAQRYGQKIDPMTFAGYLRWASPIADKITKDAGFARLVAPIFIPWVEQIAGTKHTIRGWVTSKIIFNVSRVIGHGIKGGKYAKA